MENKTSKIIARIQQLRAISKSTHSRAEAETTLRLAAKLIAEYQLSEAELEVSNQPVDDPIDLNTESIIFESGRIRLWKATLANKLAALNGLFIYNAIVRGGKSHRKVNRLRVIGRNSDVAIAMYMMDYLTKEIEYLAEDAVPSREKRGLNPSRESWCLGCVDGFISKMEAERAVVNQNATSSALVFIGNKAEEAKRLWSDGGKKTLVPVKYTPHGKNNPNTYSAGFKRGQTLSVNAGLNGSDKKTGLLNEK